MIATRMTTGEIAKELETLADDGLLTIMMYNIRGRPVFAEAASFVATQGDTLHVHIGPEAGLMLGLPEGMRGTTHKLVEYETRKPYTLVLLQGKEHVWRHFYASSADAARYMSAINDPSTVVLFTFEGHVKEAR